MMINTDLVEQINTPLVGNHSIVNGKFVLLLNEVQYSDCIASLYDDQIILQIQLEEQKIYLRIKIDFDLIFSILVQHNKKNSKDNHGVALGIKLQRFQKSLELLNKKAIDNLLQWRKHLSKFINQRGFHQIFKPIKKIGKGNFASVYLVIKYEDQKKYAAKAFSKEVLYSEEKGKQSLISQITIMRKLNHKNLMNCYEIYETQNSIYVVVELLEGGQLYDKIKTKYCFQPLEIKIIMKGLLEGISCLHDQNIMHRDLKPENVLFRKEGDWDCVIADFGLATSTKVDQYLFVRCGTPGYVAPEIANLKNLAEKYEPICDLFSVGVIFHILILRKSPFSGKQYNEVLYQNRQCNINFHSDLYKKLPPASMDLLVKLLQKNPKNRITAKQALNHQFFKEIVQNSLQKQKIKQETIQIPKPLHIMFSEDKKLSSICDSPLMTTKNNERKNLTLLRDDSCLKFKMKQNLMTGRVDLNEEIIETVDSPFLIKNKIVRCQESRFKKK